MKCLICGTETNNPKFCSKSCSAKNSNKGRNRHKTEIKNCQNCQKKLSRSSRKYCSVKCQKNYEWELKKNTIEKNEKVTPGLLKKYLIEYNEPKCSNCGWSKQNPFSKKIPIELEHIDGNAENNILSNVRLLCPNCHSLTATYKSLNIGNGRHKRRQRYKEGKSF